MNNKFIPHMFVIPKKVVIVKVPLIFDILKLLHLCRHNQIGKEKVSSFTTSALTI